MLPLISGPAEYCPLLFGLIFYFQGIQYELKTVLYTIPLLEGHGIEA